MNIFKKFILSFVVLFSAHFPIQAVPCYAKALKLGDQYVILVGTIHKTASFKGFEQQKIFVEQTKRLKRNAQGSLLVLVEDINNYSGTDASIIKMTQDSVEFCEVAADNEQVRQRIIEKKINTDFFLKNLILNCGKAGLVALNIESRFAKQSPKKQRMSEFFSNLKTVITYFEKNKDRISKNVIDRFNEIKNDFNKRLKLLNEHQHESLFADFDSELIDLNILKLIQENQDKKYLFVCAGSLHIANIEVVLKKMGAIELCTCGVQTPLNLIAKDRLQLNRELSAADEKTFVEQMKSENKKAFQAALNLNLQNFFFDIEEIITAETKKESSIKPDIKALAETRTLEDQLKGLKNQYEQLIEQHKKAKNDFEKQEFAQQAARIKEQYQQLKKQIAQEATKPATKDPNQK